MIPEIREINFPVDGQNNQYITLDRATVSLNEMGERTITTNVQIDGSIAPEFGRTIGGVFHPMELEFKGERFVLPIREPQAAKDNTSMKSQVDLTFYSWPVYETKRYFFFEAASVGSGTVIADKYKASVKLDVEDFVALLNTVLGYYFGSKITASLYMSGQGIYSTQPKLFEIDHTYLWDVIQKSYEIYGVRWAVEYNEGTDSYEFKYGYPAGQIDDHEFEYGYAGGLLRFERQLQDDNVNNVLLGRGGERNLPYRYFKRKDENNPYFEGDPDAIPELQNIYFDRLLDSNFRSYVQGWRTNPNRDFSWEAIQEYDPARAATDWAYEKGHTDEKFNPIEYVKNDASIAKYGERWGALDDNDEIYPTIQGMMMEDEDDGRADEVVDVSPITSDDIYAAGNAASQVTNVDGVSKRTNNIPAYQTVDDTVPGGYFEVPAGNSGILDNADWFRQIGVDNGIDPASVVILTDHCSITVYNASTGDTVPAGAIPAGRYYFELNMRLQNNSPLPAVDVTYGANELKLTLSSVETDAWKPTFDIWVKNIWDTEKDSGESDEEYSERVWMPILGDRAGNEAKVMFSSGFMAFSDDYEFTIVSYPVHDTSKSIQVTDGEGNTRTVQSEWRITLRKSDAEFEATGKYIPSADGGKPVAGDFFFFIGIDMPYTYVTRAERALNTDKNAKVNQLSEVNPTWVVNLDKVRVHTLEDQEYEQVLADRLDTGIKLLVYDPRFVPGDDPLTLFVQTLTYTWTPPQGNEAYILPNIEVVLADKIQPVQSPVERMQSQISQIQEQYARISDVEAVVRKVGEPLFLKKTGEPDKSSSPTKFSSLLSSSDFRQGDTGGKGWGSYRDEDDKSVYEVDKLIVREELHVNSIVAHQIKFLGGKEVLSAAQMECSQVVETEDGYICYFDQKRGSVKNMFAVGDVAMIQVFNPDNTELRYSRRKVIATDVDSITLSKTIKDGNGIPKEGDVIVQFGNYDDESRQYVIIRDVINGGYEQMLSGLTSVTATGTEYYFAGMQPGAESEDILFYDSDGNQLFDDDELALLNRQLTSRPRWFVGDANRCAEWTYENGLKIKGALTVSPSGDEAPLPVWRGAYVPGSTYYPGDVVSHNGSSWICIQQCTDVEPSALNSTYWQPYALKGDGGPYKSTAFMRTNDDLSAETPTGGTYQSPLPTSTHTDSSTSQVLSWTDGIPAGAATLWATTRSFYLDGTASAWSTPRKMTDTQTFDVEFAYKQAGDATPPIPTDANRHGGSGPQVWYDPDLDSSEDFTAMYWRAERTCVNGDWSNWTIERIKGEKGDDGLSPITADLSSEMDSVALRADGTTSVPVQLYTTASMHYGLTPLTLTAISLSALPTGITASYVLATGVITFSIAAGTNVPDNTPVTVTVSAVRDGVTYTRELVFTLAGVRAGSDGEDAVVYTLLPSVTSIKKAKDGTYSTGSVTCQKLKRVGNLPASETTDGTLKYSIDGGAEADYTQAIPANTIAVSLTFIFYIGTTVVDRETIPMIIDGEDGVSATSPVVADLNNEVASVATQSDGTASSAATLVTTASMYYGTTQLALTSISLSSLPTGITASYVLATGVITFSVASGASVPDSTPVTITLSAAKDGTTYTREVVFTIVGVRAGANGEDPILYTLLPNVTSVKKAKDGTYSVASVSCRKQKQIGNGAKVDTNDGTLKYSRDGGMEYDYTEAIQCSAFTSTLTFIYYIGSVMVDRETVPMVIDGIDGTSPYAADLDNEVDSVVLTSEGKVPSPSPASLTTTFRLYYGTTQLSLSSLTTSAAPTGVTISANYSTGVVTFALTAGATLPEHSEITITGTATHNGATVSRSVVYTLNGLKVGANGTQGDAGISYRLVVNTNVVKKTAVGSGYSYNPSTVSCQRKKTIGATSSNSTDYYLYYKVNDNSAWNSYTDGTALTAGTNFTSKVTFGWFKSTTTTDANLIDQETVLVVEDGEDGAPGANGFSLSYLGEWKSGVTYRGTSQVRYVVKHSGVYYYTKVPNQSIINIEPGVTSGWETYWGSFGANFSSVATDVLFAHNALIKDAIITMLRTSESGDRIEVMGNDLKMYDTDGDMKLYISGDNLSATGTPPSSKNIVNGLNLGSFSVGMDAINNGYSDYNTTNVATFSSSSQITVGANTVNLPAISAKVSVSTSGISGTADLDVVFQYTLDGVEVGYPASSSAILSSGLGTVDVQATIPAFGITVTPNTNHTFGIKVTIGLSGDNFYKSTNLSLSAVTTSSGSVSVSYAIQKTEIGANGFRAMFGTDYKFEAIKTGSADSTITFTMKAGNYGVSVNSSGGLKLLLNGTEYTAEAEYIASLGRTILKLT